jgi:hypothetical protein
MAEARVEGHNSFITIVNPGEIDENQKSSWALFINSKHQEVTNWTFQDFVHAITKVSNEVEKPNQNINKIYNIGKIENAKFS